MEQQEKEKMKKVAKWKIKTSFFFVKKIKAGGGGGEKNNKKRKKKNKIEANKEHQDK